MNKLTRGAIFTVANGVERVAQLGLVLRVSSHLSQFWQDVSELTSASILAPLVVLGSSAQFHLVFFRFCFQTLSFSVSDFDPKADMRLLEPTMDPGLLPVVREGRLANMGLID